MDLKIDTSRYLVANPSYTNLHWTGTLVFPLVIHYLDHCECETDTSKCYFYILYILHLTHNPKFSGKWERSPLETKREKLPVLILLSALKNMLSSTEPHLTSVWSEWSETASYVEECKMLRFVKS